MKKITLFCCCLTGTESHQGQQRRRLHAKMARNVLLQRHFEQLATKLNV